jgi:hypothetical protein
VYQHTTKSLVGKIKNKKYTLPSVQEWHSVKRIVSSVRRKKLGKDNGRQLWTAADGPLPSVVIHRVFGTRQRDFFAECISVPRVLLSVNAVVTESRTLPSVALGKER